MNQNRLSKEQSKMKLRIGKIWLDIAFGVFYYIWFYFDQLLATSVVFLASAILTVLAHAKSRRTDTNDEISIFLTPQSNWHNRSYFMSKTT